MKVYKIEYIHRWPGEPDERMSWLVVAESVGEAVRLWRDEAFLGDLPEDAEPDSIAYLGEAILPAQEDRETNPFACIECGAPAPLTRGHKPGCHQGMEPPRPGTVWEGECPGCGARWCDPHTPQCPVRRGIEGTTSPGGGG